jgi:hypothetical protein
MVRLRTPELEIVCCFNAISRLPLLIFVFTVYFCYPRCRYPFMLSHEEHVALDNELVDKEFTKTADLDDLKSAGHLLTLVLQDSRQAYESHNDSLVIPSNLKTFLHDHPDVWQKLRDAHKKQTYSEIREHRAHDFRQNCVYPF